MTPTINVTREELESMTKKELNSMLIPFWGGFTQKALKKINKNDLIQEVLDAKQKEAEILMQSKRKEKSVFNGNPKAPGRSGMLKICKEMMQERAVTVAEMATAVREQLYPDYTQEGTEEYIEKSLTKFYDFFEVKVINYNGEKSYQITGELTPQG